MRTLASARRILPIVAIAAITALSASAMSRAQGWCEEGGQRVNTSGIQSTTRVQASYPSCTITVYLAGTVTLATIYADNSSTALANPFTASVQGYWFFYAADGRYDIKESGGGISGSFTFSDVTLSDNGIWSIDGSTGNVTLTSPSTSSVSSLTVLDRAVSGGNTQLLIVPAAGTQSSGGGTFPVRFRNSTITNNDLAGIRFDGDYFSPRFHAAVDVNTTGTAGMDSSFGFLLGSTQKIRWSNTTDAFSGTYDICQERLSAGLLGLTDCSGSARDLSLRNLTVNSCTGCGGVTPPVTFTDISGTTPPAAGDTKWYTRGGLLCSLSPANVENCTGGTGGGSGSSVPYVTTVSGSTGTTITAATHGQGTLAVPWCFDNATPTLAVDCAYTRNASGDIAFSFFPAFTGTLEIAAVGANSIVPPLTFTDISTPANPSSGQTKVYTKAGTWCSLSPAGAENCTGSGGGGGSIPFSDATNVFYSAGDSSRIGKFSASLIAASTTRTYTWQNGNYTIAGINFANVFTSNQSFNAQMIFGAASAVTFNADDVVDIASSLGNRPHAFYGHIGDFTTAAGSTLMATSTGASGVALTATASPGTTGFLAQGAFGGGPSSTNLVLIQGNTSTWGTVIQNGPGPALLIPRVNVPANSAMDIDGNLNPLTSNLWNLGRIDRVYQGVFTNTIDMPQAGGGDVYLDFNTLNLRGAGTGLPPDVALYRSNTILVGHWKADAAAVLAVQNAAGTNLLRMQNGGQLLVNRAIDDGTAAQLQFGGSGRAINIDTNSTATLANITYSGTGAGIPLVLNSASQTAGQAALYINTYTGGTAPGQAVIQFNGLGRIYAQNGAPVGACGNGSIYLRGDGVGTSVYWCRASVWVAAN